MKTPSEKHNRAIFSTAAATITTTTTTKSSNAEKDGVNFTVLSDKYTLLQVNSENGFI